MDTQEKHGRKNPVATANFLCVLFFGWTVPIFRKGARRDLHLGDLYDPLESDKSEGLGDHLEREWNKELIKANQASILDKNGNKMPVRQPHLIYAIARMFRTPLIIQGVVFHFNSAVLQLSQPLILGLVISYFEQSESLMTKNRVLLYAGLFILIILSLIFIIHHRILRDRHIGMCIRVACCSLIYRKILRLNHTAMNNVTAGQVANLISNDVSRFDTVLMFLHYLWIIPIQVSLMGYLMWNSLGVPALVGMGTMILQTIPILVYFSRVRAKFRAKIANKTDERVQLMSEILSGIQVVKMYCWDKPFEMMVHKIRDQELKFITYTAYLKGFDVSGFVLSGRVSLYLTLITLALMGNPFTAKTTFILVGMFTVLQKSCNIWLPNAIITASEAKVSLDRITIFLLLDEVTCSKQVESATEKGQQNLKEMKTPPQIEHQVGIQMIKVTANWVYNQLPPTLSEVSMEIRSQSLCALVGPVGSGKSSVLHLLLGELPVQTGKLSIITGEASETRIASRDVTISYASQDPWLFAATIRDNILFDQPYDETRYQEVTRVCALLRDFDQLPQSDLTFVGERGASLSGGQRARVNLARAVYRDAELYLLDDPLSAVDACVGRHLFEECITGFLKNKTRILVTHQLQYLRQADTVVVLNRGIVKCQGTYEELAEANLHILDTEESEEPDKVEYTKEHHEENAKCKTTDITAGDNDQLQKHTKSSDESCDISAEKMMTGKISGEVYWGYFTAGGTVCSLAFLAAVFIAGQLAGSATDYWIFYWSSQEALRVISHSNESGADETTHRDDIICDEGGPLDRNLSIYIYTGLLVSCIFLITLRSVLFIKMCMNATRNVHNAMLSNVLRSTMRFFNTNPSGRILNRFTKDVGAMDELLPGSMLETLEILSCLMGILTLVAVSNVWMILPAAVMCGLFYIVRIYYLKTAYSIKRLEGIAKSPMFSDASSTLSGLTTIRSRGAPAERLLRREFDRHQDAHTGAWYLNIATATAFGFILDLISGSFVACICFSFILMDDGNTLGGYVGLAISQSLILTGMVQYGIKQSNEVISQMTAVERILQYTKLPQEGPFTTENPPPPSWPPKGGSIFKNVSMRYANCKPLVLKNLNLTIHPGWKVGIVGRTGAGKSSFISALFRLTGDELEGEIVLDGIDTKSIGLHELRPHISIIPQEPILFSASLRQNLDPFEQYSDAELWDSLREVELDNVVPSLDFQVTANGGNFSVGQRQLICLARAILKSNPLLVLDEATANVDYATDALIQNTIRRKFADCTVLTIAHRLNTVMDSDRVLVMRDGCIVEFDHPHLLLSNRDGHFSKMLQQTGNANAEKLAAIAERTFRISPEFADKSNGSPSPLLNEQTTHV